MDNVKLPRIWDGPCSEMMYAEWETGKVDGTELSLYVYTLNDGHTHSSLSWVLRQPEFTAMWPTGLTDGSDNDVWQDDIVKIETSVYVVKWDDESARFILSSPHGCICLDIRGVKKGKVVGNLRENPKLLKG